LALALASPGSMAVFAIQPPKLMPPTTSASDFTGDSGD